MNEVQAVISRFSGSVEGLDNQRRRYDEIAADLAMPSGSTSDAIDLAGLKGERIAAHGVKTSAAILFFHGGGYMLGSAGGYRALCALLSAAADAPCVAIDYRLAPEHPFPAAVEDATSAYGALLASGVSPENIAFAGDSAGGGLVVAAMLHARARGLPMPAAGYGLSPWLDLAGEGNSFTENEGADRLMTRKGALGCAAGYLQGENPRHPLASPIHADLTGLPPLLLQVGSTEMFLDDSIRLARQAARYGVHVELQIWPDMPHVWQRFAPVLQQGREAIASGGAFIRQRLSPCGTPQIS